MDLLLILGVFMFVVWTIIELATRLLVWIWFDVLDGPRTKTKK